MNSRHNWLCKDNGIYLMRVSYSIRDNCSNCKQISYIRRCSDGEFYCDTCSQEKVTENYAKWF